MNRILLSGPSEAILGSARDWITAQSNIIRAVSSLASSSSGASNVWSRAMSSRSTPTADEARSPPSLSSPSSPSASGSREGVDRPYVAGDLEQGSGEGARPDPNFGYSLLGLDDSQFALYSEWRKSQGQGTFGEIPESLMSSIGSGFRLNANKSYKLAELYTPRQLVEPSNELDGVLTDRALMYVRKPMPTNQEFAVNGHLRNREFLRSYLSEGGKLPHRKVTGLKNKFQVRLAKMVKTARKMAILPDRSKNPIYDD